MNSYRPDRRRGFRLCLFLILCLCLSACGEPDPALGAYTCVEVLSDTLPLVTQESRLVLERSGYARLERGDAGGAAHWNREGDEILLTVDGEILRGPWEDGVLRLKAADGLTLVYVREEDAEAYTAALERRRATAAAQQALWKGDWYGWWRIDNAEGELADTWYDLCARLTAQPDGSVYLLLWDEDQSASSPMGEARLFFNEDDSATAVEGYFWFMPLEGADWTMRYADGRITLASRHDAGGESFDYSLCLRPWGELWNDENERPYYYESWYLPLILAEESMPASMQVEKLK